MRPSTRTSGAVLAVAALSVSLLAASPVSPADAAACAATPGLLSAKPVSSYALPGGADVRIWDTGQLASNNSERRLAVVRIPKGTLTPTVVTAPTISRAAKPSTMVAGDTKAVVVVNGGTFNASVPGIPDRVQISHGVVRKLVRQAYSGGLYGGIAVDSVNKTITGAAFDLAGTFSTRAGRASVGSVNWQTLPSQGVAVYTNAWGNRSHPAGTRSVVVLRHQGHEGPHRHGGDASSRRWGEVPHRQDGLGRGGGAREGEGRRPGLDLVRRQRHHAVRRLPGDRVQPSQRRHRQRRRDRQGRRHRGAVLGP